MKNVMGFSIKPYSNLNKALQSLRLLLDPAAEGTPYLQDNYKQPSRNHFEKRNSFFGRRLFLR